MNINKICCTNIKSNTKQNFGLNCTYACHTAFDNLIHSSRWKRRIFPNLGKKEEQIVAEIKNPDFLPNYTLGFYNHHFLLFNRPEIFSIGHYKDLKIYDVGGENLTNLVEKLKDFQQENQDACPLIKNKSDDKRFLSYYDQISIAQSHSKKSIF